MRSKVKSFLPFEEGWSTDYDILLCPSCKDSLSTHIDEVRVDSAGGESVTVTAAGEDSRARVMTSAGRSDFEVRNGGRRHSIVLNGWCEGCACEFRLTFRQHKGSTHLSCDVIQAPNRFVPDTYPEDET